MNQPLDPGFDLRESPELDDICDRAHHDLTHEILLFHHTPGICLKSFETQCDPLLFLIDLQDEDLHFLTYAQHLTGVLYPVPG